MRPHQLCPAPRLVVAGAGRLDVVRLLAATRPELLEGVLVPGQSLDPASPRYTGAIRFRLWVVGAWCEVVLQKVASELHPKVRNHGEGPY